MPWPFGHLGLKALSIGFAILLWLVVSGDESVERGLRVPLEFQQFPSGLEMTVDTPALVDVRVRGASSTLSRLGPGDIVAQLDLRTARPGRRLYQLTPEQVRVPFGVQVVQVSPPTVPLSFEESASKPVPVVPAVEGDPAPGYVVGSVTVDPATVDVVGPRSAVARVKEAVTEPVSVAGARAAVNDGVTVGFLDASLRLKTPRLAQVRVEVLPGPVERDVRERPVHLVNIGRNLVARAVPNVVDVVLRGSQEGVNRVTVGEVVASVNLEGLGAGSYTLPVRVDSPRYAGVARVLPATVQVNITRGQD
jgi:YbbR domain-containing protein